MHKQYPQLLQIVKHNFGNIATGIFTNSKYINFFVIFSISKSSYVHSKSGARNLTLKSLSFSLRINIISITLTRDLAKKKKLMLF